VGSGPWASWEDGTIMVLEFDFFHHLESDLQLCIYYEAIISEDLNNFRKQQAQCSGSISYRF
jgi:hypothetical protein